MMKITLGNAVVAVKHQNQYELRVVGMCGDADASNTGSSYFNVGDDDDMFELEWTIFLLQEYDKVPCGYHTEKKYLNEVYAAVEQAYGIKQINVKYALEELVGRDSTCDNQFLASLDTYELFYWDNVGVKFNATAAL